VFHLLKRASAPPTRDVPASMKDWFNPYEHQKKAADKLLSNKGRMIMAHEMGTGKTVTSIYGIERLKKEGKAKNTLVVVPSGLRANFARKGLEKFLKKPSYQVVASSGEGSLANYVRPDKVQNKEWTIVSYSMFRRDPVGLMKRSGADTLVFDEFHKVRNEKSSVFAAAKQARPLARNFIGLTASAVNNDPSEIASLLTISEGSRVMSPKDFKKRYTKVVGYSRGFAGGKKKIKALQRHGEMLTKVDPGVSYVSTKSLKEKSMPKKDIKFVDVPMSPDQYRLYNLALDKLGPIKKYITQKDPTVKVKDTRVLFAQTAQARQISNSVSMGRKMDIAESANRTPKVRRLLDDTKSHLTSNSDGKVVLYSNLVRGGVDVLSAGLKSRGIDHAVFIGKGTELGGGKVTGKSRQKGVRDFQEGKKKVIIISGAGAEGLDLPNATAFYALDGHFNPERILQAEARARRLGGQSHRTPEKRVVDVRRYRSVAPPSRSLFKSKVRPQTTDQWVYNTAKRKYMQNREFYNTLEKPHKYIRKYKGVDGEWKYEYPKAKKKGFFTKLLGG